MREEDCIRQIICIIKNTDERINEYVDNDHIIEVFKGILSALGVERAFPEEFNRNGISIREHCTFIIENWENPEEDQEKTIEKIYQEIRKKDCKLSNHIKLMYVRMGHLFTNR